MECSVAGCTDLVYAHNLCRVHYTPTGKRDRQFKVKPEGSVCTIPGCGGKYLAKGLCGKHYHSHWRYNDPTKRLRGDRGAGCIDSYGYRRITVGGEVILEHRHVMERVLGRPLQPHENVHHINGSRADNRPENLELWSKKQPPGQRVADKVQWAREILALYGDKFPLEGTGTIPPS